MKIKELFETLEFDKDVDYFITDYMLTLKTNNVQKVPTSLVIQEIQNNKDVEIDLNALMKIIKRLPFVTDINKNYIELSSESSLGNLSDTEDSVSDMAKTALKRRMK